MLLLQVFFFILEIMLLFILGFGDVVLLFCLCVFRSFNAALTRFLVLKEPFKG